MSKVGKRQRSTKLHRHVGRSLVGPDRLRALIQEAASDTGGGSATPGLYDLIDLCLSPGAEGVRFSLVSAAAQYVEKYLARATRAEVVTFLGLLLRAELTQDSPRLRDAIIQYVDSHLSKDSRDVDDVAAFILRRGVSQALTRRWLPILRGRLSVKPQWSTVDALAEVPGLLPEDEYSPNDLFADVRSLTSLPDFKANVEARRHKWARFQTLAEELLRPPQVRYKPNGSLDPFMHSLESAQMGSDT
jgi:hypothetical protein